MVVIEREHPAAACDGSDRCEHAVPSVGIPTQRKSGRSLEGVWKESGRRVGSRAQAMSNRTPCGAVKACSMTPHMLRSRQGRSIYAPACNSTTVVAAIGPAALQATRQTPSVVPPAGAPLPAALPSWDHTSRAKAVLSTHTP
eukprot:354704-Chlamydomonas_euryale.AAC.7